MPKPIPSLNALYNKLASDIKAKLGIIAALVKLVIDALCAVIAGQIKLIYLYIVDVQNNQFPDTADTEANGGSLERIGRIYLNRDPFTATEGVYTVTVTGTPGAVINGQITFKSNGNSLNPGNLYILDNAYTMPGATGTITLRSLNLGLNYLLNVTDQLEATQPIIGVNGTVTVASVVSAPREAEDTEIYRQAILNAIRLEPQGGAKTDYRIWASDAQGVRLVYPYVKNGEAGTVQVFVEAVTADSTDGHGTPDSTLLQDVADVIEMDPDTTLPTNDRGRRPIQANVVTLPVTPQPVDVVITGLQVSTPQVVADVLANLNTYLYGIRPYIAGADLPRDKNDLLTAVRLQSVVIDTLGNSNGFTGFTMFVQGVQVNQFTFALSNIPYLRNVTYN